MSLVKLTFLLVSSLLYIPSKAQDTSKLKTYNAIAYYNSVTYEDGEFDQSKLTETTLPELKKELALSHLTKSVYTAYLVDKGDNTYQVILYTTNEKQPEFCIKFKSKPNYVKGTLTIGKDYCSFKEMAPKGK